ncbi:hypothetical protein T484DRAFT_1793377 [Baffinella frigidus]|nr:hypothetical protein T484DRAFT_1793377 [Cryptophyta sp. CCMP2293]
MAFVTCMRDIVVRAPVIPTSRDNVVRAPVIPTSVSSRMEGGESTHTSRKLQKEVMLERGGAGVYSADYRQQYLGLKVPKP